MRKGSCSTFDNWQWRNGGVLLHIPMPVRKSLSNLQRRGAFTAAFTSKKLKMTIKISFLCHWQLIPNFFSAHLLILLRWKTKGAVGVVCAVGNWLLIANYCTWWSFNFEGLTKDGGRGRLSASLFYHTFQMSLISAGSISLDSTFKRLHLRLVFPTQFSILFET